MHYISGVVKGRLESRIHFRNEITRRSDSLHYDIETKQERIRVNTT